VVAEGVCVIGGVVLLSGDKKKGKRLKRKKLSKR